MANDVSLVEAEARRKMSERYNEAFFEDGNKNVCVVCGQEIDFSDPDWAEADGPGVICGNCWREAEADDDNTP